MGQKSNPKPTCHQQRIWNLKTKPKREIIPLLMQGGDAYLGRVGSLCLFHVESVPSPSSFSRMKANSSEKKARKSPRIRAGILTQWFSLAIQWNHLGNPKTSTTWVASPEIDIIVLRCPIRWFKIPSGGLSMNNSETAFSVCWCQKLSNGWWQSVFSVGEVIDKQEEMTWKKLCCTSWMY